MPCVNPAFGGSDTAKLPPHQTDDAAPGFPLLPAFRRPGQLPKAINASGARAHGDRDVAPARLTSASRTCSVLARSITATADDANGK